MSSPASCDGGGVKSWKPAGSEMSSLIDDSGELIDGVSAKDVRSEVSESSSRDIVVVVVTTEGAIAATRLAACGEPASLVVCNGMQCLV